MANSPAIFSSLKGKKVTLQGRFDRSERPSIEEMIQLQQGKVVDSLNKSVDYLVVADMSSGIPAQRKAQALNSKGANIQVLDVADLDKIACPTEQDIIQIIRMGKKGRDILTKAVIRPARRRVGNFGPSFTITGESFDGLDLSGFEFRTINFERCSFAGIIAKKTVFTAALNCNFTHASLTAARFGRVSGSEFSNSNLSGSKFGHLEGADFTGATMEGCRFVAGQQHNQASSAIFKGAVLARSIFYVPRILAANFEQADLRSVQFFHAYMPSASFRHANLHSARFSRCHLVEADFSNTNARDAVFEEANLSGARFNGADLSGVNFTSARTDRVDFSKAKNCTAFPAPVAPVPKPVGPALAELESLIAKAKRIDFEFKVQQKRGGELESVIVKDGRVVADPAEFSRKYWRQMTLTFSGRLLKLASRLRGWNVRYETLSVSSSKSPKSNKELREIVLNAISEAFAQPLPAAGELAKTTKEWRGGINKAASKEHAARKKAKAARNKKLAKKIEKEVGKVTDVATFLKALELRVDVEKIKKAMKMLRAERFQLFNDVTDAHLNGVVKSQTDADLVYACRIESDGKYACCTQNLNICGGLRGSICKHLLVLIIGLVQAGKLDPQTIDEWVAKSLDVKAELNKETMGEIFIRYKGAEAGEVDWRPTETMPEDYYAL